MLVVGILYRGPVLASWLRVLGIVVNSYFCRFSFSLRYRPRLEICWRL